MIKKGNQTRQKEARIQEDMEQLYPRLGQI
jgi:hypothetical protein